MQARWATFDCYGTLIDWNEGLRRELTRLFGPERAPALLARYHAIEPEVQSGAYRSYADVLAIVLSRLAAEAGLALPAGEEDALAASLPAWPPFPEVPPELEELQDRGWRLAVLSNCDRDLIGASARRLGVPFDAVVVAEDVRAYKPARAHWERFFADTGAEPERHVHVAASLAHDIAPARAMGLTSVWINRLGERAAPAPDRELPDLAGLADAADDLVPPG